MEAGEPGEFPGAVEGKVGRREAKAETAPVEPGRVAGRLDAPEAASGGGAGPGGAPAVAPELVEVEVVHAVAGIERPAAGPGSGRGVAAARALVSGGIRAWGLGLGGLRHGLRERPV